MWLGVNNGASGTPDGALQGKIVESAVACAELCRDFGEGCKSFTWRPDKGNSCWLKNDWTETNERTSDQHTWSGIRCDQQESGISKISKTLKYKNFSFFLTSSGFFNLLPLWIRRKIFRRALVLTFIARNSALRL